MLCASGAACLSGRLPSGPTAQSTLSSIVPEIFPDLASARAVGKAYLAAVKPAEQMPAELWRAILAAHPLGRPPATRQQVASWVRRDFADAAMVSLDGWLLSRTEARLCALAALLG
jgi:hypothetical protein